MEKNEVKLSGPDVSIGVFGGVLDVDGAGYFPGLELINFIACDPDGPLPDHGGARARMRRFAHDFARQLVADSLTQIEREKVLLDARSAVAVAHLFRCLELDVENVVKAKRWERTHFFPYSRALVHWDARSARRGRTDGEVQLERRYYRGGGAYAYSVLDRDPDIERRGEIRAGFRRVYPEGEQSSLDRLASTLRDQGFKDSSPTEDTLEPRSQVRNDAWDELYREGIRNILGHFELPAVQRIRAVINWTGIWLVLLEAARAAALVDRNWSGIVVDSASAHAQLRRASQKCLKDHLASIEDASNAFSARSGGTIDPKQLMKIKGFFTGTAATCGLLNSPKGRRHFTLKLGAIEALVLASTPSGTEMTFEQFVAEWLGARCGLAIGREAASRFGLLAAFDATIFEENERQFAEQMRATGMLKVYSDATRMVSTEVGI
jgi:hypothetical protein